ncbi:MAG: hypothetical protein ACI89X_000286 [Planctomycetota bacterium]
MAEPWAWFCCCYTSTPAPGVEPRGIGATLLRAEALWPPVSTPPILKKSAKPKAPKNLDKQLFEAGLQCHKRLWLDYHEPSPESTSASRQEMSRVGDEMRELARTAFPMGVVIDCDDATAAAKKTAELLADNTPVLFDATFVHNGLEAQCDILVVHHNKETNEKMVDLFEIKSGTKIKHRYVNDLALQAIVLEQCGLKLKSAYLLHINPKYSHVEGEEFPPMQLLRSADVTAKVEKQLPNVTRRLKHLRLAIHNDSVLELPMGTFCKNPFPCPHTARCQKDAPPLPLHQLPGLTRAQEIEMHKEGIEELMSVDGGREGLTFRQRRTLACMQQQERITESFVAEELFACERPLHFVSIAAVTEPLPRFHQQRPWQQTPYAWAAKTIHEDGRVESTSWASVDRSDPRAQFVKTLSRHIEIGGTMLCWRSEAIREMRTMLDSVPDGKTSVRALLGFEHVDMMQLLEAGVFDPKLLSYSDFRTVIGALLDDRSGDKLDSLDANYRYEALQKARTPRVRAATRDKISAEIQEALSWQSHRLADLFELFAPAGSEPVTSKDVDGDAEAEAAEGSAELADKPAPPKRAGKPRRQLPDAE